HCCPRSPRHPPALPSFPTRRSSDLRPPRHPRILVSRHRLKLQRRAGTREVIKLPLLHRLLNPPIRHPPEDPVKIDVFQRHRWIVDRKSTRLNSSHVKSSYAVFCLKK